jgi:hypothetical protein
MCLNGVDNTVKSVEQPCEMRTSGSCEIRTPHLVPNCCQCELLLEMRTPLGFTQLGILLAHPKVHYLTGFSVITMMI